MNPWSDSPPHSPNAPRWSAASENYRYQVARDRTYIVNRAGYHLHIAFCDFLDECFPDMLGRIYEYPPWEHSAESQIAAKALRGFGMTPHQPIELTLPRTSLSVAWGTDPRTREGEWIAVERHLARGTIAGPRFIKFRDAITGQVQYGETVHPLNAFARSNVAQCHYEDDGAADFPMRGLQPFLFMVRLDTDSPRRKLEITLKQTRELTGGSSMALTEQNTMNPPPTEVFFDVSMVYGDAEVFFHVRFEAPPRSPQVLRRH
ncbi:hypothetical protein JCM8547_001995 [Rhodosporidiobolus lusitaniae]